jgi:hypothetical protein
LYLGSVGSQRSDRITGTRWLALNYYVYGLSPLICGPEKKNVNNNITINWWLFSYRPSKFKSFTFFFPTPRAPLKQQRCRSLIYLLTTWLHAPRPCTCAGERNVLQNSTRDKHWIWTVCNIHNIIKSAAAAAAVAKQLHIYERRWRVSILW